MENFKNFNLGEELKKRGQKTFGFIPFALKPNGSWVNLPVMMVIGKEDGPVILADACAHGDEYEGTEGIIGAYKALNPENMKGSFIGVPAVNLEAFAAMKRYSEIDFVPVDLNRAYPGREEGYLTQSIGHYYFNEIVIKADAIITLHGGGNNLYLDPITLYQNYGDEMSRKSREMAEAFGLEALWQNNIFKPENGILDEVVAQYKIPAITPEIGGQTTRLNQREHNVERIVKGILNVLCLWEVLPGEVTKFDNQYHLDVEYIFSRHGGICKPQKKGGERVKKGDTLSIITDIFGQEVDVVRAPFDGRVVGYWAYSICNPRSWVYMVGHEIGA